MWPMIASLEPFVQSLAPAFTTPSFTTHCQLFLGWLMCLGTHTPYRVGLTIQADHEHDHSQRHGLDRFYNFFNRSAWSVDGLAYHVAVLVVTLLNPTGWLYLIVDDTLAHKRGRCVFGLGWFRDACASTKKRVATASGHNWVVLGLAVRLPLCPTKIWCLPLLARLHLPGKGQPSCVALTRAMLTQVREWFPQRRLILVGDGAYAAKGLLETLEPEVVFVGRLRGDAAVYDPRPPRAVKGRRGPKPKKGPRRPSPKEAAAKADRARSGFSDWAWQTVTVTAYGLCRELRALSYEVVWPTVLGLRVIRVVVVRDPSGKMRDAYLFSTDLKAELVWVIETFAARWSIEVLFRASKQVMDLEAPQHWSQSSVEKLAPWVWSVQSVIMVWYLTVGHQEAEAEELAEIMGPWDSEWSLRHMVQVLRRAILNQLIDANSTDQAKLQEMLQTLKNCVNLAA
jgi:hypothetical protein